MRTMLNFKILQIVLSLNCPRDFFKILRIMNIPRISPILYKYFENNEYYTTRFHFS